MSTDQTATAPAEPTRDELFEALSNRRRRYTLHYLQTLDGQGPVELSKISTQVAAWELGIDADALTYDDRKNVHTSLYQFHAPKLDDLGLIHYARRDGTIELTSHGATLNIYPDTTTEHSQLGRYFFVLSSLSSVAVVGSLFDAPVVSDVPATGWAVLVAALFLLSSVLLFFSDRINNQTADEGPPPEVRQGTE